MPQTKVARQTLCEPAQSRCTYAEIFAGEQIEHSDQAPALTPTVRTLQCGHTVWGKKTLAGNFPQVAKLLDEWLKTIDFH